MLTKLILLTWSVACVFAAPSTDVIPLERQQPTVIPILSQSEEFEPNGTYKFSYETGNGIKREEEAYEKILPSAKSKCASSEECSSSDESNEIHVQKGSYSYVAPDGTLISVSYIADENGFQPIGTHINLAPSTAQSSGRSNDKSGRALKALVSSKPASVPAVAKDSEQPSTPAVSEATSEADLQNTPAVPISEQESKTTSASETTQATETPAPESEPESKTTVAEVTTQAAETPALEPEQESKTTLAGESTPAEVTSTPAAETPISESNSEQNTTPSATTAVSETESQPTTASSSVTEVQSQSENTDKSTETTSVATEEQSTTVQEASTSISEPNTTAASTDSPSEAA